MWWEWNRSVRIGPQITHVHSAPIIMCAFYITLMRVEARDKVNFQSSDVTCFVLRARVFRSPGTRQVGYAGWPASCREICLSLAPQHWNYQRVFPRARFLLYLLPNQTWIFVFVWQARCFLNYDSSPKFFIYEPYILFLRQVLPSMPLQLSQNTLCRPGWP